MKAHNIGYIGYIWHVWSSNNTNPISCQCTVTSDSNAFVPDKIFYLLLFEFHISWAGLNFSSGPLLWTFLIRHLTGFGWRTYSRTPFNNILMKLFNYLLLCCYSGKYLLLLLMFSSGSAFFIFQIGVMQSPLILGRIYYAIKSHA